MAIRTQYVQDLNQKTSEKLCPPWWMIRYLRKIYNLNSSMSTDSKPIVKATDMEAEEAAKVIELV